MLNTKPKESIMYFYVYAVLHFYNSDIHVLYRPSSFFRLESNSFEMIETNIVTVALNPLIPQLMQMFANSPTYWIGPDSPSSLTSEYEKDHRILRYKLRHFVPFLLGLLFANSPISKTFCIGPLFTNFDNFRNIMNRTAVRHVHQVWKHSK